MNVFLRINLYNFVFVQAFVCAFAQRSAFNAEVMGLTSKSSNYFNLIKREIPAKSKLYYVVSGWSR